MHVSSVIFDVSLIDPFIDGRLVHLFCRFSSMVTGELKAPGAADGEGVSWMSLSSLHLSPQVKGA